MMIVRAQGGAGNQIFQYAFCKYLEQKARAVVGLDLGQLGHQRSPRAYVLDGLFADAGRYVPPDTWPRAFPLPARWALRYVNRPRLLRSLAQGHLLEDGASLRLEEWRGHPIYCLGYWQSLTYVEAVGAELRARFLYLTEAEKAMLDSRCPGWSGCDVTIHVRRGDYVSDPRARRHHGLLSMTYYRRAIEVLQGDQPSVRALVFSDDINWVRTQLPDLGVEPVFVSADVPDVIQLKMMAEFERHIISNSTFSWWGAWLAKRSTQTIAPARWYASGGSEPPIFPASWRRL